MRDVVEGQLLPTQRIAGAGEQKGRNAAPRDSDTAAQIGCRAPDRRAARIHKLFAIESVSEKWQMVGRKARR